MMIKTPHGNRRTWQSPPTLHTLLNNTHLANNIFKSKRRAALAECGGLLIRAGALLPLRRREGRGGARRARLRDGGVPWDGARVRSTLQVGKHAVAPEARDAFVPVRVCVRGGNVRALCVEHICTRGTVTQGSEWTHPLSRETETTPHSEWLVRAHSAQPAAVWRMNQARCGLRGQGSALGPYTSSMSTVPPPVLSMVTNPLPHV